MSAQKFVQRLNDLNCYLLIFRKKTPKQLDQDEIIEFLDHAKVPDTNIDILKFLMKNLFLISSIWINWRRSGAPMV
jgi:hypothetical protein